MSRRPIYKFRLYVSGDAPNSVLATANLVAMCKDHLEDRYEIEVVDVFQSPERALEDGIFVTPTLIKVVPPPVRRIVGTLSNLEPVLLACGLFATTG
jgi:circadian clock protein KaiB